MWQVNLAALVAQRALLLSGDHAVQKKWYAGMVFPNVDIRIGLPFLLGRRCSVVKTTAPAFKEMTI